MPKRKAEFQHPATKRCKIEPSFDRSFDQSTKDYKAIEAFMRDMPKGFLPSADASEAFLICFVQTVPGHSHSYELVEWFRQNPAQLREHVRYYSNGHLLRHVFTHEELEAKIGMFHALVNDMVSDKPSFVLDAVFSKDRSSYSAHPTVYLAHGHILESMVRQGMHLASVPEKKHVESLLQNGLLPPRVAQALALQSLQQSPQQSPQQSLQLDCKLIKQCGHRFWHKFAHLDKVDEKLLTRLAESGVDLSLLEKADDIVRELLRKKTPLNVVKNLSGCLSLSDDCIVELLELKAAPRLSMARIRRLAPRCPQLLELSDCQAICVGRDLTDLLCDEYIECVRQCDAGKPPAADFCPQLNLYVLENCPFETVKQVIKNVSHYGVVLAMLNPDPRVGEYVAEQTSSYEQEQILFVLGQLISCNDREALARALNLLPDASVETLRKCKKFASENHFFAGYSLLLNKTF